MFSAEGPGSPLPPLRQEDPVYDRSERPRRWRALDLGATMHVDCPAHGVVTASVPWVICASRFTYAFEEARSGGVHAGEAQLARIERLEKASGVVDLLAKALALVIAAACCVAILILTGMMVAGTSMVSDMLVAELRVLLLDAILVSGMVSCFIMQAIIQELNVCYTESM